MNNTVKLEAMADLLATYSVMSFVEAAQLVNLASWIVKTESAHALTEYIDRAIRDELAYMVTFHDLTAFADVTEDAYTLELVLDVLLAR